MSSGLSPAPPAGRAPVAGYPVDSGGPASQNRKSESSETRRGALPVCDPPAGGSDEAWGARRGGAAGDGGLPALVRLGPGSDGDGVGHGDDGGHGLRDRQP